MGLFTRILSMRNIPAIFMLLIACSLIHSPAFAMDIQEDPLDTFTVTLKQPTMRVAALFTAIKQQTGLTVFFSNDLLNDQASIDAGTGRVKLKDLLEKVTAGKPISYRLRGKVIVLEKTPSPVSSPAKAAPELAPAAVSVKGKVVDDKTGAPVMGATILVKGTREGTTTDAQGNFSLQMDGTSATLVVTFIGYETKEIPVRDGANIVVRLGLKSAEITETVVTGIVTRRTGSFTGTAVTFTAEQLRSVGNQNVIQSLRALDPSFRVFENNILGSNPNTLPDIQVRGATNLPDLKGTYIGNPNMPLFILDGFEVPLERIFDLDMNRVERLTILKDATATALYGSRSANGVVVINTKQPQPGKLTLSYTGDFTFETPDLSGYHLLNASQKLEVEKAAGLYNDFNPLTQQMLDERYDRRLAEVKRGVNTDWISQPLRTSFGQRHYVYLEGGDSYLRYAVDFSANKVSGVMKGSGRETYAGGMMISYRHKNLVFRNYLSVTQNRADESPYGSFREFTKMNPYWRKEDAGGNIIKAVDTVSNPGAVGAPSLAANPLYNGSIGTENYSQYLQVNDNFSLEWMITDALKLRSNFSLQTQRSEINSFFPAEHTLFMNYSDDQFLRKGLYKFSPGKEGRTEFSTYLDFNQTFGGKHLLYATAGVNLGDERYKSVSIYGEGFPSQFLNDIGFATQYQEGSKPQGSELLSRRVSLLGNVNYSYDNRYVADLSVSTDGSSKFGADNRFAPFWAAGIGWNVHNEAWAKNMRNINLLKFRLSYGATGTQNFPAYQAMTTYTYVYGQRYLNGVGAYMLGLGNDELKWQQKKTLNLGTDITLFESRVSITANYYWDRTQNQLIDLSIPPSMGFDSYKENLGVVDNKGFEINTRVIVARNAQKDFSWSLTGSVFYNKNKLMKISDALDAYNKQQNDNQVENGQTTPTLQFKEGQSISAIYTVRSLGIDPATGREVYLTKDGQRTFVWNPDDKVVTGDSYPAYRGLFGTILMVKGFTLNAVFSYQFGGQVYNQTLVDRVENADIRYNVDDRVYEGRWRKPGDHTFFKNIADNTLTMPSSRFVQDDKQVICESVSLQYDFKRAAFLAHTIMKTLRVNAYMNQPFRFTSIRQERGLDYPFAHLYSLSVQTSF